MTRRPPWLLLACLLVVLCCGCTMWSEKRVSSWSAATGGEHLERLFWQDVKRKNFQELETHLAPMFVLVTATGTRDRGAALEYLRGMELDDYTLGDVNIRPGGGDMVVTYTFSAHGSNHGQPLPASPVRMMTVWKRLKNGWVAVAHSETQPATP